MHRLAPLILSTTLSAAEPAPVAEPPFTLDVSLAPETRDSRTILVATGHTDLPDGTILNGSLLYASEPRPIELITLRKDLVKSGAYRMPLDAGFGASIFPGRYVATITIDTMGSQPPAIQERLGRRSRLLKWTGVHVAGDPGAGAEAERRLREAWRSSIRSLVPLAADLAETFERHVSRPTFDSAAWSRWHDAWTTRLTRETAVPHDNVTAQILPRLHPDWGQRGINPPWVIRDHAVHELSEAATWAERTLRASPRDDAVIRRVRETIAFHRQQIALANSNLPILRPSLEETRAVADDLRREIVGLRAWLQAARRGEAGHAAADWHAWSGAWRTRLGAALLRLNEGAHSPDLSLAALDFASAAQALESAASLSVSGVSDAPATDPLVESALQALDRVVEALPR